MRAAASGDGEAGAAGGLPETVWCGEAALAAGGAGSAVPAFARQCCDLVAAINAGGGGAAGDGGASGGASGGSLQFPSNPAWLRAFQRGASVAVFGGGPRGRDAAAACLAAAGRGGERLPAPRPRSVLRPPAAAAAAAATCVLCVRADGEPFATAAGVRKVLWHCSGLGGRAAAAAAAPLGFEVQLEKPAPPSSDAPSVHVLFYFAAHADLVRFENSSLFAAFCAEFSRGLRRPPAVGRLTKVCDTAAAPLTLPATAVARGLAAAETPDSSRLTPATAAPSLAPRSPAAGSPAAASPAVSVDRFSEISTAVDEEETLRSPANPLHRLLRRPAAAAALAARREAFAAFRARVARILGCRPAGLLPALAAAAPTFGLRRCRGGWRLREWLPGVEQAFLIGDFNAWDRQKHPLEPEVGGEAGGGEGGSGAGGEAGGGAASSAAAFSAAAGSAGVFSIFLPDTPAGDAQLRHRDKYKLHVVGAGGGERRDVVPPHASLVWKAFDSEVRDAVVWETAGGSGAYNGGAVGDGGFGGGAAGGGAAGGGGGFRIDGGGSEAGGGEVSLIDGAAGGGGFRIDGSGGSSLVDGAAGSGFAAAGGNGSAAAGSGFAGGAFGGFIPFHTLPPNPSFYDVYPGLLFESARVDASGSNTFAGVAQHVVPRAARQGYDALVLLGVLDHRLSSFGSEPQHCHSLCAQWGTPDELAALVRAAHTAGLAVVVSLVVSHVVAGGAGLAEMDAFAAAAAGGDGGGGFFSSHPPFRSTKPLDLTSPLVFRYFACLIARLRADFNIDGVRIEYGATVLHGGAGGAKDVIPAPGLWAGGETGAAPFLALLAEFCRFIGVGAILVDDARTPLATVPPDEGGLGFDFVAYPGLGRGMAPLLAGGGEAGGGAGGGEAGGVSCEAAGGAGGGANGTAPAASAAAGAASAVASLLLSRPPFDRSIAYDVPWQSAVIGRRPLRIAMFAWESLHTHAVGGVAPHVTELAAALTRAGHEVHVFARARGCGARRTEHFGVVYHECPFELNADFIVEIDNMCASFVAQLATVEAEAEQPLAEGGELCSRCGGGAAAAGANPCDCPPLAAPIFDTFGAELNNAARKFDVYHAHDWLAAGALRRLPPAPGSSRVLTMHSTEFGRCGNRAYADGISKRVSDIERRACVGDSDRVICVSGVLKAELVALYGVDPAKVQVVYNGVNATNFDGFEDGAPIKARVGVAALQPMLLFVGRLAVQKGPDLLLEALPAILRFRGDAVVVFVGDGYMRASLEARAAALGVAHACRFVGARGGAELRSLFKACDAVVVPSRNEPFGIVVLEAWSAYKPVVATVSGGPRDFVSHNVDGLLVQPDPGSIAWGCCEIMRNFDHGRWMGERGRVRAAFNFSWDAVAADTARVYYEQLDRHDAAVCERRQRTGGSLLELCVGASALAEHMTVFDPCPVVAAGVARVKLLRLLLATAAADGFGTLVGAEFGHPDPVDIPRPGNNFDAARARRRFALAADPALKFKHLDFFDACLMRLRKILAPTRPPVLLETSDARVVALAQAAAGRRAAPSGDAANLQPGYAVFVFNFSNTAAHDVRIKWTEKRPWGIAAKVAASAAPPQLRCVLHTEEQRFGGSLPPPPAVGDFAPPTWSAAAAATLESPMVRGMSAFVLASADIAGAAECDPVIPLRDVDAFCATATA